MKLRLTLTCEYEVMDACYNNKEEIVKLNQQIAGGDPFTILDDYPYTIKVEEIK